MRPGVGTIDVLRRSGWAAPLVGVLLVACAVGPNFERPPSPEAESYTAEPMPGVLAPGAGDRKEQRLRLAQDLSARWWELFRSAPLDGVVARALADSPSLVAARATLAQAREAVVAARGSLLPQVDATASAGRTRTPALRSGLPSSTSTLYSVGLSASYLVDVFGGTRRTVEQQAALAELRYYELAAAWLTLTGNVATRAIEIAALGAQIDAVEAVIADDEHNLDLVRRTFEAGKVARADVLVAETQLATDRTQLPALRQRLAAARHALSALAGRVPSAWTPPAFTLDDFTLPGELPVSLPSELARQRPDVRAAEARLHAASAAIGVATAQLYPQLTLSGSFSREALTLGALSSGAGTAWAAAGALATPLFHGGTLRAERRAAIDAYEASLASYRQTLLVGFQQVADALRALEHDAELVGAAEQLLDTATESLELQRVSYQAGKTDLLRLIDAERAVQQARSGLAVARGQRLQDTVQLFAALGGGWWQAGL
jgi:NodT family efflux transporter outer membrane factor (OMF) lipoprotein